jgi:hypothetical protein
MRAMVRDSRHGTGRFAGITGTGATTTVSERDGTSDVVVRPRKGRRSSCRSRGGWFAR